jgi:hypothetical protein
MLLSQEQTPVFGAHVSIGIGGKRWPRKEEKWRPLFFLECVARMQLWPIDHLARSTPPPAGIGCSMAPLLMNHRQSMQPFRSVIHKCPYSGRHVPCGRYYELNRPRSRFKLRQAGSGRRTQDRSESPAEAHAGLSRTKGRLDIAHHQPRLDPYDAVPGPNLRKRESYTGSAAR